MDDDDVDDDDVDQQQLEVIHSKFATKIIINIENGLTTIDQHQLLVVVSFAIPADQMRGPEPTE